MQYGNKLYPCRYCVDGMVRFFTSFQDVHGNIHHARKVFAVCSNSDCPGKGENTSE